MSDSERRAIMPIMNILANCEWFRLKRGVDYTSRNIGGK